MLLYGLLVFIHVVVSLFLIAVVLLQTGKRADLAGAFGGGGSQTAFGPRGASNFLSRATTISAAVFMVTSLALAIMSSQRDVGGSGSVLDEVPASTAPATPAPQSPAPAPEQQPQQPPSEK
jgi:preprotein translocase subunit SecG